MTQEQETVEALATDTESPTEEQVEAVETAEDIANDTIAKMQREIDMLRTHDDISRELATTAVEQLSKHENANGIAKSWKKSYDETMKQLREHAFERPTFGPLFDQKKNDDVKPELISEPDPQHTTNAVDANNDWREVSVASLEIDDPICERLIDVNIHTLGDMADFTSSGKLLTDIDGIGKVGAEKIEEASVKYFEAHPVHGNAIVAENAVEDGDDEDEAPEVIDLDGVTIEEPDEEIPVEAE